MNYVRTLKVFWWVTLIGSIHYVTSSFTRFFVAVSVAEEFGLLIALIELFNLTVGGWFFFTFFVHSTSTGLVTQPNLDDTHLHNRLASAFVFTSFTHMALQSLELWLVDNNYLILDKISVLYVLVASGLLAITFGGLTAIYFRHTFSRVTSTLKEDYARKQKAKGPMKRLGQRLDDAKLEELCQLLYESSTLQKFSIRDIAEFVWFTVLWTFIFEALVELASRAIR